MVLQYYRESETALAHGIGHRAVFANLAIERQGDGDLLLRAVLRSQAQVIGLVAARADAAPPHPAVSVARNGDPLRHGELLLVRGGLVDRYTVAPEKREHRHGAREKEMAGVIEQAAVGSREFRPSANGPRRGQRRRDRNGQPPLYQRTLVQGIAEHVQDEAGRGRAVTQYVIYSVFHNRLHFRPQK